MLAPVLRAVSTIDPTEVSSRRLSNDQRLMRITWLAMIAVGRSPVGCAASDAESIRMFAAGDRNARKAH
jgi:hypothetical protein